MTSTRLSSAILLVALAGCTQTITRPVPLPDPAEPTLTPVIASQVECLAPAAYVALVNRERAERTWGKEMQAIIETNNAKATQK